MVETEVVPKLLLLEAIGTCCLLFSDCELRFELEPDLDFGLYCLEVNRALLSLALSSGVLGLDLLLCLTLFLDFITSLLSEIGRGRPCNLRNSPQALHRTCPDSSLRQRGVV